MREESLWVLLFEARVAQVRVVDAHNAVVLLEQLLLVRLAPPLQALHQQAQGPAGNGTDRLKRAGKPYSKWPTVSVISNSKDVAVKE